MSPVVEYSVLLSSLALLVAVLGAQVSFGWTGHGRRDPPWRRSWRSTLVAAATFGSLITGSTLLALTAEGLPFLLGFRATATLAVWVGVVVASVPVAALLVHSRSDRAIAVAAIALALLTVVAEVGWIEAAGFRPGVVWMHETSVGAVLLMTPAFAFALHIASSESGDDGERSRARRIGATMLFGVALVVGAEIVKSGAGLTSQVSSDHQRQVTAAVLSLLFGVGLPLLMLVLSLDLHLRTRALRPGRRRRRRKPLAAAAAAAAAAASPADPGTGP